MQITGQNISGNTVPLDYVFIPTLGYYKVHNDSKSWQDALISCEKEGAHLTILNSEKEADEIISFLKGHGAAEKELWVGLHDQYNNRNYVTIFSKYFKNLHYLSLNLDVTPHAVNFMVRV